LAQACNYVHLNPKRAGLVGLDRPLQSYGWSSYPAYLKASLRQEWLRTDRLLGEHGLQKDNAASRREFSRRMEQICPVDLAGEHQPLRRGWKLGAEDFRDRLVDQLKDEQKTAERARDRAEVDQVLAQRLARECLRAVGWSMRDLTLHPKGDPVKVEIARQLRTQTPMSRGWIARHLHIGSAGYLSQLLAQYDDLKV
jgi:hypothetical protein